MNAAPAIRIVDGVASRRFVVGSGPAGVREVEGNRCLVTFMRFDLGHYEFDTKLFEPNALPDWKETTAHRTRELMHLTSPLNEEC